MEADVAALFLTIFLLVEGESSSIVLPPETYGILQLVHWGDRHVAYDHVDKKLFTFRSNGEPLHQHRSFGEGPGEFRSPAALVVQNGELHVVDKLKFSILTFDQNLTFLRERQLDFFARDLLLHEGFRYLVGVKIEDERPRLIRRYDEDWNLLNAFGSGLEGNPRFVMGMQAGWLVPFGRRLVWAHIGLPQVEIYEPDGSLYQRVQIPGFEEPFISEDIFNGKGKLHLFTLSGCFITGQTIHLVVDSRVRDRPSAIYSYHPPSQSWEKRPWVDELLWDKQGHVYRVVRDEEDLLVRLEPIALPPDSSGSRSP